MVRELRRRATVMPGGRIELSDPELPVGHSVVVVVLHDSPEKSSSILQVINGGPKERLFKTPEDVEAYLQEEKASWDR
ncbi:MAG: hypothetical protein OXC55_03025 [Chloroflexi bacterium]|nr:hypothetical protein [Chloroflexota bacterium]